MGNLVRWARGDLGMVKKDTTLFRPVKHGDAVEHGGLASSIGANQAQDLAVPHIEADVSQDFVSTETEVDAVDTQQFLINQLPPRSAG